MSPGEGLADNCVELRAHERSKQERETQKPGNPETIRRENSSQRALFPAHRNEETFQKTRKIHR
jgi:hypothetical protein